jgi:hypothetical protein
MKQTREELDEQQEAMREEGITIRTRELIKSLGTPDKVNTYSLKPDEDGVWWLSHDVVGSGEPLSQWLERENKL